MTSNLSKELELCYPHFSEILKSVLFVSDKRISNDEFLNKRISNDEFLNDRNNVRLPRRKNRAILRYLNPQHLDEACDLSGFEEFDVSCFLDLFRHEEYDCVFYKAIQNKYTRLLHICSIILSTNAESITRNLAFCIFQVASDFSIESLEEKKCRLVHLNNFPNSDNLLEEALKIALDLATFYYSRRGLCSVPGEFILHDHLFESKNLDMTLKLENFPECEQVYNDNYDYAESNHEDLDDIYIDYAWIKRQCEEWLKSNANAHSISIGDLVPSIFQLLTSLEPDELVSKLSSLLGDSSFDLIEKLVRNQSKLLRNVVNDMKPSILPAPPSVVGNLTIVNRQQQKEDQRNLSQRKKLLKLLKTLEKLPQNTEECSLISNTKVKKIVNSAKSKSLAPENPNFRLKEKYIPTCFRKSNELYDSINIPAEHQEHKRVKLLSIDENFEPFFRQAFRGIGNLNVIQSLIYPIVYKTSLNMLVCAPTGSGKTNIALMAILREIGLHRDQSNNVIREEFKVIYIAPMKALASEITRNYSSRLSPLNIKVRELTGDMKLTKRQIRDTHIIITTPEKWDVITRKNSEISLVSLVNLLIIDEIHLLYEERGAVIEALVARTLRQIEQVQKSIRIIGLSATITNYEDVAQFLRVDPDRGLFFFDGKYRPVPLTQEFIGVKSKSDLDLKENMDFVCYQKVKESLEQRQQVLVFVNSRNETINLVENMIKQINKDDCCELIRANQCNEYKINKKLESRNRQLNKFIGMGFGFHNAGMNREDRRIVESAFFKGIIRCLVSTATLAWGVNLPAHRVIINGTEVYNFEKGRFNDLEIIDVLQIFGRAGRPGLDTSGEAILLTSQKKLSFYFRMLTENVPIESQFESRLTDNLNAEIVLGTVSNMYEAVQWISYTYMWVRLPKNPLAYGFKESELIMDSQLVNFRSNLIERAAQKLERCKMIRFDPKSGNFFPTDLGRIASHYYIAADSIEIFNELFDRKAVKLSNDSSGFESKESNISDADILNLVSRIVEFKNIRLRNNETAYINKLANTCRIKLPSYSSNSVSDHDKVSILLQCYISRYPLDKFSLESDMYYITQNIGRVFRALFEIAYRKDYPRMALKCLNFGKMVEYQVWDVEHPLSQFNNLNSDLLYQMKRLNFNLDRILESSPEEITQMLRGSYQQAQTIIQTARSFPSLVLKAKIQPLTANVFKINLMIETDFEWNDEFHETIEPWWVWIQDSNGSSIYESQYFLLHKKKRFEPHHLTFIVPGDGGSTVGYQILCFSDRWIGTETIEIVYLDRTLLPNDTPSYTPLLNLTPLSKRALEDLSFEALYDFSHFNPLQTQTFFAMFHTNHNVLLGSPTGSGKTIVAELAMLKLFRDAPQLKVVYIAPLKALVRERLKEWNKFVVHLKKILVELTGDYTPDVNVLMKSDIVVTTPEKWDSISRNWKKRDYVQKVGLMIIDEIHLLGEDRGPIIEAIISRMLYISNFIKVPIRLVGLSTAISNIKDLADWMNVDRIQGLFNFHPSVRPIPMEFHISGVSEKHYCPRMALMNKPTLKAIEMYSPEKSVLIFVSSRRQTRLTSIDLVKYNFDSPKKFLNIKSEEIEQIVANLEDQPLIDSLRYGIGIHHAGLSESDKKIVEKLFLENKIQILISTATLAWGVNLPAHLVVIKGTEYYDAKTRKYIDYPITDVLQMLGRAGRPQYDTKGYSVIFVEQSKKNFYKKFLYEPFPIESSLLNVLHDHMNAEIVAGTIQFESDAVDYLIWTFLLRRLLKNPIYYGLESADSDAISGFLHSLVTGILRDLKDSHCVFFEESGAWSLAEWEVQTPQIAPSAFGKIASYYYLHYKTIKSFYENLKPEVEISGVVQVMCDAYEYAEVPVRHNEDIMNDELARRVRFVPNGICDSPNFKASLLYQAYLSRLELPISDYITDTKQVIDQNIRIVQAMTEVCAERRWLRATLMCAHVLQMTVQAQWIDEPSYFVLPGCRDARVQRHLHQNGVFHLAQIVNLESGELERILRGVVEVVDVGEFKNAVKCLPLIKIAYTVTNVDPENCKYSIVIRLQRRGKLPLDGAYCPQFAKKKDEGWWVMIGDDARDELLALKKINNFSKSLVQIGLSFVLKDDVSRPTLYLISDSYIGLDLQESLKVPVRDDRQTSNDNNFFLS